MKTILYKIPLFTQIILLIVLQFIWVELRCQDAHFSQFDNTPLAINPSQAGAFDGNTRVIMNYRDQWRSISMPYKTFAFSADASLLTRKLVSGFLGAGISFVSDNAGDSKLGVNQINLSLAYHVRVAKNNFVSAGIQSGVAQRSIRLDNLTWDNQYDGNNYNPDLPSNEPIISNNHSYMDFGAGVQWTYSKRERNSTANNQIRMNAGVSIFHLNKPNISFYSSAKDNMPYKIVTHGAVLIGLSNSKMTLAPSILYIKQGPLQNFIVGSLMRFNLIEESKYTGFVKGAAFAFGGYYRIGDAIIPSLQLEVANYAVGISYDINASDLKNASKGKGGIEFSLRYLNPNPFTGKTVSKSPRFF